MPRLNKNFHPEFTPNFLKALFKKSIYTMSCFVQTNPEILAKITGSEYSQIVKIKNDLLTQFSSNLRIGYKHYLEVINQCAIIPSGIKNLDKLLNGGFMTGKIYELCGFAGCGKTQICIAAASNICSSNQQIFFIDTKNDISAHRAFNMIKNSCNGDSSEIMAKFQVCHINSAYELLKELHHLEKELKKNQKNYLGFKVMIIDSISALFQKFYNQTDSLSILNSVANLLKFVAVKYHLAILLTNILTTWTNKLSSVNKKGNQLTHHLQVQPALGKYWVHVPHNRIAVKKLEKSNECFLMVLKSSFQPKGKTLKIQLSDTGVQ